MVGIKKQLLKEFMRDPKKQYFDKLGKLLKLYPISKASKKEVYEFVERWYNERGND